MTLSPNDYPRPTRNLYRVREVPKLAEFAFLTESSLRHLIFQSEARKSASGEVIPGNGLKEAGVLIRQGTKILIDIRKLRQFFEGSNSDEMDIR